MIKKEVDWKKRYMDLLDWIEMEWLNFGEIPDELYHASPRCVHCNMRHQGNC